MDLVWEFTLPGSMASAHTPRKIIYMKNRLNTFVCNILNSIEVMTVIRELKQTTTTTATETSPNKWFNEQNNSYARAL